MSDDNKVTRSWFRARNLSVVAALLGILGATAALAVGQGPEVAREDVSDPREIDFGERVTFGFLNPSGEVIDCPDGAPLTQTVVGGKGASEPVCEDGSIPEAIRAEVAAFRDAQAAAPDLQPHELPVEREIGIYILEEE